MNLHLLRALHGDLALCSHLYSPVVLGDTAKGYSDFLPPSQLNLSPGWWHPWCPGNEVKALRPLPNVHFLCWSLPLCSSWCSTETPLLSSPKAWVQLVPAGDPGQSPFPLALLSVEGAEGL